MPMPNLIHPVPIEIEQIDRAETFYDEDAREPIQFAARKIKKIVPGQVRWSADMEQNNLKAGLVENSRGYVLFRYIDLVAQDIIISSNDRFTKIGTIETDVYVDRLEPVGHYPDAAGPTLVKVYFSDHSPAKQK